MKNASQLLSDSESSGADAKLYFLLLQWHLCGASLLLRNCIFGRLLKIRIFGVDFFVIDDWSALLLAATFS